jgi:hypothetical protein
MDAKVLGPSAADADARARHSVRAAPHDFTACRGLPALPHPGVSTPNAFANRAVHRFDDLTG